MKELKPKKWSEKVKKRRISWFGHLSRLPGRPQTTWLENRQKTAQRNRFLIPSMKQ